MRVTHRAALLHPRHLACIKARADDEKVRLAHPLTRNERPPLKNNRVILIGSVLARARGVREEKERASIVYTRETERERSGGREDILDGYDCTRESVLCSLLNSALLVQPRARAEKLSMHVALLLARSRVRALLTTLKNSISKRAIED